MEYTIQKLARLAGVSTRTLRYYDQIGLLCPRRLADSGYRIYGGEEVDALQQILFYRELGLELSEIRTLLQAPSFDRLAALKSHLHSLQSRRERLDCLISTVAKTIRHAEGEIEMCDQEKFEGFKRELVEKNERKYGAEIRAKYGEKAVEQSNEKLMGLTREQYDRMQALGARLREGLEKAVREKADPAGETGRELARLHKEWLCFTWPRYQREAHLGVAEMYVQDGRFTGYYDREVVGCAAFLRDAVHAWADTL